LVKATEYLEIYINTATEYVWYMWIAKFKQSHDCILGNRCKEFKVTLQAAIFSVYKNKGIYITASMHYMSGKNKDIDNFVVDLKKDKDVIKLERKGDTFFLIEKAESKAVGFFNPKIFLVKPVLMRPDGYEIWEVASWEKEELSEFLKKVKKTIKDFTLIKFVRTPINNVFFPKLMPDLTKNQKQAVELAIKHGYYVTPRKVDLRKLAKMSNISLATFQEHLRKAEEKLIPNLLSYAE